MISQFQVSGCEQRVVQVEHAALGQVREGARQRRDRTAGASLIEDAARFWKPARLADHQPA